MSFSLETFGTERFLLYLAGSTGFLFCLIVVFIAYLHRRIEKLLGGTHAKNIEESLALIRRDLDAMMKFKEESTRYLRIMEERVRRSTQAVETIRFNPFKGTGDGGNQSFSTAILNENGDGVILSSLYSRERVSIFSKPVVAFTPQYELSEEEQETLKKAKEKLSL